MRFLKLIRFDEWNRNTIYLILIVLLMHPDISTILFTVLYFILYMSYGYLMNSYADRHQDHKIGKKVYIYMYPKILIQITIMILGTILLALPLIYQQLNLLIIGIVMVLLATFYSARPIRFKEHGFFGLMLLSVTMLVLPLLLFMAITGKYPWIFLVHAFFYSLMCELGHQVEDLVNDKKTKTKTWSVRVGKIVSEKVLRISIIAVLLSPLCFLLFFELTFALVVFLVIEIFTFEAIMDNIEIANEAR